MQFVLYITVYIYLLSICLELIITDVYVSNNVIEDDATRVSSSIASDTIR